MTIPPCPPPVSPEAAAAYARESLRSPLFAQAMAAERRSRAEAAKLHRGSTVRTEIAPENQFQTYTHVLPQNSGLPPM